MFRVINGKKIKKQRGSRSLAEIAAASGNKFTDVALLAWEKEEYKPKDDKVPYLLAALGCTYDDISEEYSVVSEAI